MVTSMRKPLYPWNHRCGVNKNYHNSDTGWTCLRETKHFTRNKQEKKVGTWAPSSKMDTSWYRTFTNKQKNSSFSSCLSHLFYIWRDFGVWGILPFSSFYEVLGKFMSYQQILGKQICKTDSEQCDLHSYAITLQKLDLCLMASNK